MIFDKKTIKADFEKAANNYDNHAALQRSVAQEVIARTSPSKLANILDIGSGTGCIAQNVDWNITQLDLAYAMCEKSQCSGPVVNGDMESLPFANNSFDAVVSSLALQWAVDPRAMLRESSRVCKADGKVMIATFGPQTLKELKQLMLVLGGSEHVSAFLPPQMLQTIATKQGFAVDSCDSVIVDMYYKNVRTLFSDIKGVGASNKRADRGSFFSKSVLAEFESTYAQSYGDERGIRATWEVLYLELKTL